MTTSQTYPTPRGGICHCRHCRRQCKFFVSGVNFSIFTHFFEFLSLKLLKLGKIDGVKFLTNSMSANTTYNMLAKESSKSEVCGCHQKCTSLLTTMTRGHCLLICVCQPSVTGNLSSPATKRSRPSIQVQEEPFWMLMPVIVVVIIMIMMMIMMMLRRTPHLLLTLLQVPKWGRCTWENAGL